MRRAHVVDAVARLFGAASGNDRLAGCRRRRLGGGAVRAAGRHSRRGLARVRRAPRSASVPFPQRRRVDSPAGGGWRRAALRAARRPAHRTWLRPRGIADRDRALDAAALRLGLSRDGSHRRRPGRAQEDEPFRRVAAPDRGVPARQGGRGDRAGALPLQRARGTGSSRSSASRRAKPKRSAERSSAGSGTSPRLRCSS